MASTLSTREQFLLYLRDEDMRGALLRFLTKRFTDQLLLFWEEVLGAPAVRKKNKKGMLRSYAVLFCNRIARSSHPVQFR